MPDPQGKLSVCERNSPEASQSKGPGRGTPRGTHSLGSTCNGLGKVNNIMMESGGGFLVRGNSTQSSRNQQQSPMGRPRSWQDPGGKPCWGGEAKRRELHMQRSLERVPSPLWAVRSSCVSLGVWGVG